MQKKRCGLTCQGRGRCESQGIVVPDQVGEAQNRGGMTRRERARTLEGLMPNAGIHVVPLLCFDLAAAGQAVTGAKSQAAILSSHRLAVLLMPPAPSHSYGKQSLTRRSSMVAPLLPLCPPPRAADKR